MILLHSLNQLAYAMQSVSSEFAIQAEDLMVHQNGT